MEIEFDGGHNRTGHIWIEYVQCDGCHKNAPCLMMDGSEQEYTAGSICRHCIETMFTAHAKEKGTP